MSADLHCHTKISDGSTGLDDLILLAKKRRISTIAVTDHDTLAGVTRAKVLGERYGVKVIPGVEFSCYDYSRNRRVHLLGYLFSYPDRLEGMCKRCGDARKQASMQMISKVMRFYPISAEMVAKVATGSTNIYLAHIMHTLMHAGYADAIYGSLFKKLFDYETGTCRAKIEYPDVFEVLELLKSANAVTVLAHPSVYDSMDLLPELIEKGLNGVEVWHPRNSEEDTAKLIKIADEHNLIKTGGSDFHGMYTRHPVHLGTCITPDECVEEMFALKDKMNRALASVK